MQKLQRAGCALPRPFLYICIQAFFFQNQINAWKKKNGSLRSPTFMHRGGTTVTHVDRQQCARFCFHTISGMSWRAKQPVALKDSQMENRSSWNIFVVFLRLSRQIPRYVMITSRLVPSNIFQPINRFPASPRCMLWLLIVWKITNRQKKKKSDSCNY
jgi:hypothetical protein